MARRYALVHGRDITAEAVAKYLPSNYRVEGEIIVPAPWDEKHKVVVISGEDKYGWSLNEYIIPRLNSGSMHADEIDISPIPTFLDRIQ